MRAAAAEVAATAAEGLIKAQVVGQTADRLLDAAVRDVKAKLN